MEIADAQACLGTEGEARGGEIVFYGVLMDIGEIDGAVHDVLARGVSGATGRREADRPWHRR